MKREVLRLGVEKLAESGAKIAIDVDETIFNSVKKHWRLLTLLLPKYFGWDSEKMPSYDEVCIANGTHSAYRNAAPSPDAYEDYLFLNEAMRFNRDFNANQEVIDGAREALTILEPLIAVYLTTRPKSLAMLTRDELQKHGFPDKEVIARPDSVPLDRTSMWKISWLSRLCERYKLPMIMIDDSITTHRMIEEMGIGDIGTILFDGPMTPRDSEDSVNWEEITLFLSQFIFSLK